MKKYKPHLETQDGVIEVTGALHDLVIEYLKKRAVNLLPNEEDELYNIMWKHIDEAADYPDYSNYN